LLKARLNAHLVESRNNLGQLALFAAYHSNPEPGRDAGKLPKDIPAGTVVLPGVLPGDRLSWTVSVLPGLNQRTNPTEYLLNQIDTKLPWSAEPNQAAARTRLPAFVCPENTPEVSPNAPAITCYVGIAGVGADAATLELAPGVPTPTRAGAFRYDGPTPFDRITDGLSQTLLMSEAAADPGPWLRGGFSTVRGLDDAAGARPLIGFGGQFGGFFPNGANMALCDGSVRTFTPQTTPALLFKLATIAGGEKEAIPGD
jgi:prepilin-type processing-associated H-X9-DG protein